MMTFLVALFLLTTHPFYLTLLLITTTITISISMFNTPNYWLIYFLLLIYLGGVLILFLYTTSISSNITYTPLTPMTILIPTMYLIILNSTKPQSEFSNLLTSHTNMLLLVSQINIFPLTLTLIFILTILLTTTKILSFTKGPLR